MDKRLSGISIISLVLIYLVITAIGRTTVNLENIPEDLPIVDEGIELDQEPIINVTWVQLKMKMGYRDEWENGTVTRLVHNYGGGAYTSYGIAYNITVTVKFQYENSTYRGYTTETYNVTDKMDLWDYYYWDITEIDGLYYEAEAYGWQEIEEIVKWEY